jgi:uncharacterized protein YjiS (DUF1127 family)
MSLQETLALSSRPLPPLSRVLVSVALTVATWELRQRTRKHLSTLPPHMLRDIGVDEHTALIEADKPFWRD